MQLFNKHLLALALWAGGTYGIPPPTPDDGDTGDDNKPQPNFAQGAIEGVIGGVLGSLAHGLGWGARLNQGNSPAGGQMNINQGTPNVQSDPFHVPDMEPGWDGYYQDWPDEVSQRRIKGKLGPKANELWNEWHQCMEEEIQERPDIYSQHTARGSYSDSILPGYLGMSQNLPRGTMYAILELEDYCVQETKAETPAMAHRKAERQTLRRSRTQDNDNLNPSEQKNAGEERELEQQQQRRADWPAQIRKELEEKRIKRQRQKAQRERWGDDGLVWSRVGQAGDRVLHVIGSAAKAVQNKGGPHNGVIVPPMGGASGAFKFGPI
ncbi:MAG: hypothetical protein M1816_005831 [Peltula sp. TS41687]|nr:MAG: hypothetical protein M1816_005831 [Peltula sp. TS41687]